MSLSGTPSSKAADLAPGTFILKLADYVAGLQFDDIPPEVVKVAERALIDTVGVAIAALNEDAARAAIAVVKDEPGPACIWGTAMSTTARNAALVNGLMAHAHDMDDNHWSMIGHGSAPLLPAVLAVADEVAASGKEVLAAFVAGLEVEGRIGKAATFGHNARGWHTTSTIGVFGAAAAASRLMKLNPATTATAMNIAASLASGIRQNFGYMVKPLHPGSAASQGVLAAKLAAAGFNASPAAFDGHEGFLDLFCAGGSSEIASILGGLGQEFETLTLEIKKYPSCSHVQAGLDIVLNAIASGEIKPDLVDQVSCHVNCHTTNLMRYPRPKDPLQARFSYNYCIAAALTFKEFGLQQYSAKAFANPKVWAAIEKVNLIVQPELATIPLFEAAAAKNEIFTIISVHHSDGNVFTQRLLQPEGHPENPISQEKLDRKFMSCVQPLLNSNAATSVLEGLKHVASAEVFRPADVLQVRA